MDRKWSLTTSDPHFCPLGHKTSFFNCRRSKSTCPGQSNLDFFLPAPVSLTVKSTFSCAHHAQNSRSHLYHLCSFFKQSRLILLFNWNSLQNSRFQAPSSYELSKETCTYLSKGNPSCCGILQSQGDFSVPQIVTNLMEASKRCCQVGWWHQKLCLNLQ